MKMKVNVGRICTNRKGESSSLCSFFLVLNGILPINNFGKNKLECEKGSTIHYNKSCSGEMTC